MGFCFWPLLFMLPYFIILKRRWFSLLEGVWSVLSAGKQGDIFVSGVTSGLCGAFSGSCIGYYHRRYWIFYAHLRIPYPSDLLNQPTLTLCVSVRVVRSDRQLQSLICVPVIHTASPLFASQSRPLTSFVTLQQYHHHHHNNNTTVIKERQYHSPVRSRILTSKAPKNNTNSLNHHRNEHPP